jgi:tellurium resistance protein TerD
MNLDKSLRLVLVEMDWNTRKYSGTNAFELDSMVFFLNESGRVNNNNDVVVYSNLVDKGGVCLDLTKVPLYVTRVAIGLAVHMAVERRQNFSHVTDAYVRLAAMKDDNDEAGAEQLRYYFGQDLTIEAAIVVCEVYRHNADWKFKAVGAGYMGGVDALYKSFGINR